MFPSSMSRFEFISIILSRTGNSAIEILTDSLKICNAIVATKSNFNNSQAWFLKKVITALLPFLIRMETYCVTSHSKILQFKPRNVFLSFLFIEIKKQRILIRWTGIPWNIAFFLFGEVLVNRGNGNIFKAHVSLIPLH